MFFVVNRGPGLTRGERVTQRCNVDDRCAVIAERFVSILIESVDHREDVASCPIERVFVGDERNQCDDRR